MEDLISRQAAIDEVKQFYRKYDNDLLELLVYRLEQLPPAQPEQKTGNWVPIDDEPHEEYECNRCGFISWSTFGPGGVEEGRYNYCPECGAKMEE